MEYDAKHFCPQCIVNEMYLLYKRASTTWYWYDDSFREQSNQNIDAAIM